jgi:phage terminase large subunit-like protein
MVEGESGILAVSPPDFRPHYESARRRLLWPNGAQAALYSSEEPDQLRGPQHHLAWGDELAKWRHQRTCWANLLLGLRLGEAPKVMATTTPKPTPLIKQLRDDPTVAITHGATFDNRAHLSADFIYHIKRLYEGTRLGRQELYGEILEDFPGALWNRDGIDNARVKKAPPLTRIVVAVDPPVTHGENADACGIVVAGICGEGHTYVLADLTAQGLSPHQWCKKALLAYETFEADRLVAEVNQGGDLVETLIRQISPGVSYRGVRASRGKIARAEPVAALYERGLVHHVGGLNQLEDQLCSYTGEKGEKSPDRLDALVWAITDLALGNHSSPRIRSL